MIICLVQIKDEIIQNIKKSDLLKKNKNSLAMSSLAHLLQCQVAIDKNDDKATDFVQKIFLLIK